MIKKLLSSILVVVMLVAVFSTAVTARAYTNEELQAQINLLLAELAKLQADLASKTGAQIAGYSTSSISSFASVADLKTHIASTTGNSASGQAVNSAIQAMADFGMTITDLSTEFITVDELVSNIYGVGDPTEVAELITAMKNLGGNYASIKTNFGSMKGFFTTVKNNIGSKRLPYLTGLFEDLKDTGGTWADVTIDSGFTSLKSLITTLGKKDNLEDVASILAKLDELDQKYDDLYASTSAALDDLVDEVDDGNSSYYDRCTNYNKGKYGSHSKYSSYYDRCRDDDDDDDNDKCDDYDDGIYHGRSKNSSYFDSCRSNSSNSGSGGSSGSSGSGGSSGNNGLSKLGNGLTGGCKGGGSSIPSTGGSVGATGGRDSLTGKTDAEKTAEEKAAEEKAAAEKKAAEDAAKKKSESNKNLGNNSDVLYKIACEKIEDATAKTTYKSKRLLASAVGPFGTSNTNSIEGFYFKLKSGSLKNAKPYGFVYKIDRKAAEEAAKTLEAMGEEDTHDGEPGATTKTQQTIVNTDKAIDEVKDQEVAKDLKQAEDKVDYSVKGGAKKLKCTVFNDDVMIEKAKKEAKDKENNPGCTEDGKTCEGLQLFKLVKHQTANTADTSNDTSDTKFIESKDRTPSEAIPVDGKIYSSGGKNYRYDNKTKLFYLQKS